MDFESILNTIQPFLIMFAALMAAFLTATWISVVIWTFRDIRARSRDIFAQILGTLMVFIFFPLFPLPGWILYLILRPRETLSETYERSLEEEALLQGIEERMACPGCNRRIEEEFMVCPTCHTRLKKACPACGRLLHLRWNICPYCGAVQTTAKAAPALAPQPVAIPLEPTTEVATLPGTAPSRLPEPAADEQASQAWPEGTEPAWDEEAGPAPGGEGGPPLEAGAPDETGTDKEPPAQALPFQFD
jgi:RNA polymerase subunit RPABC4/transcription elongation factor Spt4